MGLSTLIYFEIYVLKCGTPIIVNLRQSASVPAESCRVGKGDQSIRQWEGINYDLWVSGHVLTLMSSSMTFVRK